MDGGLALVFRPPCASLFLWLVSLGTSQPGEQAKGLKGFITIRRAASSDYDLSTSILLGLQSETGGRVLNRIRSLEAGVLHSGLQNKALLKGNAKRSV